MIAVEHLSDLARLVGRELGVSGWRTVTFEDFVAFGNLSGDAHWTHTDRERARREAPFGDAIAQGFLTLSFLTMLSQECVAIHRATRWLNYGFDRVRFTNVVLPGDRVRLRVKLAGCDGRSGSGRVTLNCALEIEGKDKAALIADWIVLVDEVLR